MGSEHIKALEEIRAISTQSGTNSVTIYDDGVEIGGSLNDSDDQAGFVKGTFTPEEVAEYTRLYLTDERTTR